MIIGFLIISFACTFKEHEVSFWLSLLSSVILGVGSALGESTTLGFCKGFPSRVVGYFGSGTGFAGMFGSGIILILKGAGLDNGQIFFIITPTIIPYFLSFWWIYRMKVRHPYIPEEDSKSLTHS
jgi:battenin